MTRAALVLAVLFAAALSPADALCAAAAADSAAAGSAIEAAGAGPDSAAVRTPVPGRPELLRGTAEPLGRAGGRQRDIVSGLGFVPYIAIETVFRPIVYLVGLQDTYDLVGKLKKLMVWNISSLDTKIAASFGWETGFGWSVAGLRAKSRDWLGTGIDFTAGGSYLTSEDNLLIFEMETASGPFDFDVVARSERKDDVPFYGLGMDAPDVRHDTGRRRSLLETTLGWRIHPRVRVFGSAWAREITRKDPGHGPRISEGFPDLYAKAEQSDYVGLEAGIEFDRRNDGEFSTRGGLLRLIGGTNDARSVGNYAYRHYSAEAQLFADIYRENRSLALRVYAEGMSRNDPTEIPFTEFCRLGGRRLGRGFDRDRFTGADILLATLEYRYPLCNYIQGRIFTEWGAAVPEWDALHLDEMKRSMGLAMVVRLGPTSVSVQGAWSDEGAQFYIGTGSIFDLRSRRLR